ncbi:uncharacterized protein LOC119683727 [Teleopsis dalmanni]|uniref:uncharacterized protein LOC119683727 n=1 Tax=Teleopsis dalmanni TaxID=139649 RepID=UPI0018CD3C99|nr:uncharacterized protein LOC119683727 [Teleopsis dalmanni]
MASKYFEKLCAAVARNTPFREVLTKSKLSHAKSARPSLLTRSAISTVFARQPGTRSEFLKSELQCPKYKFPSSPSSAASCFGGTHNATIKSFGTSSKPPDKAPISSYVCSSFQKQLMSNSSFNTTKRAVATCRSTCNKCVDNDEADRCKQFPEPFKHFDLSKWSFPADCCKRKCPDLPRYDELYWQPSNKNKKYQQTWSDCKMVSKPRIVCCLNKCKPPIVKRTRCPVECACSYDQAKFNMICKLGPGRCPRLTMPCCKGARYPPCCKNFPKPKNCCKQKCPYPSFSECRHKKLKKPPIVECKCLRKIPNCELERARQRLARMGRYF